MAAIPDYQSVMLPLLKLANDGKEHKFRDSWEQLATEFHLTEDQLNEYLPNSKNKVFQNRVGWASLYLRRAGLLESTRHGHFKITDRGKSVISESPEKIDNKYLERFQDFIDFKTGGKQSSNDIDATKNEQIVNSEQTPEESLGYAYQAIRQSLASDLLDQVKNCSPSFFEGLVIELLVKMGYGGSQKDAGQAIGKSGDEGIDGIIKEDRLGLDVIYIQAKKWENQVGRPEIQKFAGALQGFRAKKGIFITASSFSAHAQEFVNKVDSRIILIDGQQLAQLMIDFNIGVSTKDVYEIKRIDTEYFEY